MASMAHNMENLGTATLPWDNIRKRNQEPREESQMHRKGWTLVDCNGWRWAVKGLRRIRVCRERILHTEALKLFAEVVDREEENGDY